jgi:hypothetical protein
MRTLLALILLCFFLTSNAQDVTLRGHVTNQLKEPCSYAAVVAKQKSTGELSGTTCDEKGHFQLKLKDGTYIISIHLLGYKEFEKLIQTDHLSSKTIEFILEENSTELGDVTIYADGENFARKVMKKAIEHRGEHAGKGKSYTYQSYIKNSVQRTLPDTAKAGKDSLYLALKYRERPRITQQIHLIETISDVRFEPTTKFQENIIAFHDYNPRPKYENRNVSFSVEYGEPDVIPEQLEPVNNYVLKSNSGYNEYSLYNRLLDLPALTEKKILSPIGEGALLSYAFTLENSYMKDSTLIYIIKFEPIFSGETLLSGFVHIRSDNWAMVEADVSINAAALYIYEDFHFHQYYQQGPDDQYISGKENIDYAIKDGLRTYQCNIQIERNEIKSDTSLLKFTEEVIHYEDAAFDRDSAYWAKKRTMTFNTLESNFAHRCDSLQNYYTSDEYYQEIDSSYNKTKFWDFILFGVGYRNRKKEYDFFIDPLIAQINPVGIGGYRHRLGGKFHKEYPNNYLLETDVMVDYGFHNKDVKGRMGAGLTYFPKKFVRTFLRLGDYYDMINTYASLGSVFSRSNYVRTQTFSIAQRMEIINGLFAELTFEYSDQKPITNLKSDVWSQKAFGEINQPIDFQRYIKSEIRFEAKYKFKQKYIIKKNKKILLGSTYPEMSLNYRKGIPGLFNSEINFDYMEIGIKQEKELGRLGDMQWSFLAGSFLNKSNLRILEHRYFRGSDIIFFSDPVKSYQLLGPTLSTSNTFLRGNYFHHFNGILLNKIPLIKKLKLTEAIGGAFISIPSQDFHHAEFYAGIERTFRFKGELFRMGVYGCTADSTFNKPRLEFKLGINFFDPFHKKWQY